MNKIKVELTGDQQKTLADLVSEKTFDTSLTADQVSYLLRLQTKLMKAKS
jgi:hypothetical protein